MTTFIVHCLAFNSISTPIISSATIYSSFTPGKRQATANKPVPETILATGYSGITAHLTFAVFSTVAAKVDSGFINVCSQNHNKQLISTQSNSIVTNSRNIYIAQALQRW